MRRILLAAMAASCVAFAVSALATGNPEYYGGCNFGAVSDSTPDGTLGGEGSMTGEVDYRVLLFDRYDPAANPVSATVWCELRVNGVVADATAPAHWTLAGAGADVVTYTAGDGDVVTLCTVVAFDGADLVRDCAGQTQLPFPPNNFRELVDQVFELIADMDPPDLLFCAALKTAGIPALINAAGTGLHMDVDDCDLWDQWERLVDFVPYDD